LHPLRAHPFKHNKESPLDNGAAERPEAASPTDEKQPLKIPRRPAQHSGTTGGTSYYSAEI
jgi:hypothetical protein